MAGRTARAGTDERKPARTAAPARPTAADGIGGGAATAGGRAAGQGPSPDELGQRLRAAREEHGISLRTLAKRIEVSPSFISQVELGRASPSVGTLYALVTALGLSLDDVMTGEPEALEQQPEPVLAAASAVTAAAAAAVTDTVTAATSAVTVAQALHSQGRMPESLDPLAALSWIGRGGQRVQRASGRRVIKMSGVTWERLTHDDDPLVDFLYVTYAPGSASCSDDDLMRHGGREYGHVVSGRIHIQVGFETYELDPGDSIHFDSTTPHRLSNPFDEPCVALWVVVGRRGDGSGSGTGSGGPSLG